jgi:hypothetical protein
MAAEFDLAASEIVFALGKLYQGEDDSYFPLVPLLISTEFPGLPQRVERERVVLSVPPSPVNVLPAPS